MSCARDCGWGCAPSRCGVWARTAIVVVDVGSSQRGNAPDLLKTVAPGSMCTGGGRRHLAHRGAAADGAAYDPTWTRITLRSPTSTWCRLPHSYVVEQYGYHPNKLALSFDDGPDPAWTPRILDVLKQYNVKGYVHGDRGGGVRTTPTSLKRYVREGHEIGNHTFTHPDISEISTVRSGARVEPGPSGCSRRRRGPAAVFRPPYSIDQEPDTNDQAAPPIGSSGSGYTIIGDKIDTDDWNEHPRKSPQEITDNVLRSWMR